MKQIRTRLWVQFLKEHGLIFKRVKGSHHVWDFADNSLQRPVVFRGEEKEIPLEHIYSNLRTLSVSKKDFEKWLIKNS